MKEKPIVLVTGASGFVGRFMTALLLAKNYQVRITDLYQPSYITPKKDNLYSVASDEKVFEIFDLPQGSFGEEVIFLPANITDPQSESNLRRLMDGVEAVFHIAALFKLDVPFKKLWEVNVEGTKRILRLAQSAGVKYFINTSSGGIYGNIHDTYEITEESKIEPPENYAKSKWEAEKLVFKANSPEFQVASLRPGDIYGPWNYQSDSAVALWNFAVGPSKKLSAIPRRRTHSSRVHVVDVAKAGLFIYENKLFYPEAKEIHQTAFNIADEVPTGIEDILIRLDKELNKKRFLMPIVPYKGLKLFAFITEKLKLEPAAIRRGAVDTIWHDHRISSEKIKKQGFNLKYPDPYEGALETYLWHEARGWDLFQFKKKKKG